MAPSAAPHKLTIGLTGGIASGKSTAAEAFAAEGVTVIDADVAARQVVEPGQPALAEIRSAFGEEALGADGHLDRPWLRQLVFADDAARKRLEQIVHPRVREFMLARRQAATGPYVILMIPLLVEGEWRGLVDRILVIDVPEAVQLERLMKRDGIDETLARRMIDAQISRDGRLAQADDVVLNSGRPERLRTLVRQLHRRYLMLASGAADSLPPQYLPASRE